MLNKKTLISSGKIFGSFSLVMITIGSVDSIRNLPAMALFGGELLFFFFAAVVFFLLPSTLVITELAAAWPVPGGIYTWVKKAFGKRIGFLAIWLQWVENIIWYPTILSFTAATIGYLISPQLINNKMFLVTVITCAFWSVTIINLLGVRLSMILGSFCAITGLLLPILVIIGLGAAWLFAGKPLQISLDLQHIIPNLHDPEMWVSLTAIIMSFCGMEVATIHAEEVKNPGKSFPLALSTSTAVLIMTLALGALSVAIVLPENQISLVAGVMQTFHTFLAHHNLHWAMPVIAIVLVIGSIGGVNNWIIAPTKGLFIAAKEGHLPMHLTKSNRRQAPHILLIYQAIVVTLLMIVFFFVPTINGSYWILTVLAAQLYMLMYIILFAAAVRLRFKHPDTHRPFKIPGKKIGVTIVSSVGIIGALITFAIGFVPPNNIAIGGNFEYESLLIGGLLLMGLPPFIIYRLRYSLITKIDLQNKLETELKENAYE